MDDGVRRPLCLPDYVAVIERSGDPTYYELYVKGGMVVISERDGRPVLTRFNASAVWSTLMRHFMGPNSESPGLRAEAKAAYKVRSEEYKERVPSDSPTAF